MVHKMLPTVPAVPPELSENVLDNSLMMEKLPQKSLTYNNICCSVEQLNHQNKCSEALIVLLQYMINDVSNPYTLFH